MLANNNEPWYQSAQKFEVPKFTAHIKDLLIERWSLSKERDQLLSRLKKGSKILNNPNISAREFKEGTKLFCSLVNEMTKKDARIMEIEIEITGILEAKLSEIGFIINLPKGENEKGVIVDGKQVNCVSWASMVDDNKITMTPEEVWFFGRAKKLFNANPSNIEFIVKKQK